MFPLHLLIALAEEKEGIVRPVLEKCGVHPDAIVAEAQRLLANLPKTAGDAAGHVSLASRSTRCWSSAFDEATRFKDEFVSTEHLLLSHRRTAQRPRRASCWTAPAPPTTPF